MNRKIFAAVITALSLGMTLPGTSVLADGRKVVTLGADLTDEQKQSVLRYFGVAGQNIETIIITNEDERNHLGSFVPLEQIGTKTYSCALVCPTRKGGIQVKTANLSWVTSNMIASTLSTSGVSNCDVLAACPFEVSGTGALTGILTAYEHATDTTLDEEKKELATQELITTSTLADEIGQAEATQIINEAKIQIIQGNVVDADEINIIINNIADSQDVQLSDDGFGMVSELMTGISEQDYDYEDMEETLERVEENMEEQMTSSSQASDITDISSIPDEPQNDPVNELAEEPDDSEEEEELDDDSILMNTDDSALGEAVIFDATDHAAITETEAPAAEDTDDPFEITSSDSYEDDSDDEFKDEEFDDEFDNDEFDEDKEDSDEYIDDDMFDDDSEMEDAEEQEDASDEMFDDETGNELTDDLSDDEINEDLNDEQIDDASLISVDDMQFDPVSDTTVLAGTNELNIYVHQAEVLPGSGSLSVISDLDGSEWENIPMYDDARVVFAPMDSSELAVQSWEEGTKVTVYLSRPLGQNNAYTLMLSEEAFTTPDGIVSEAVSDNWTIQTGSYGLYIEKDSYGIHAEEPVSGMVLLDGSEAAYAVISNSDDPAFEVAESEFYSSANFDAVFHTTESVTLYIDFYGADDSLIKTVDYTVNVE